MLGFGRKGGFYDPPTGAFICLGAVRRGGVEFMYKLERLDSSITDFFVIILSHWAIVPPL